MLSVVILEGCAIYCMLSKSCAEVLGEKCLVQLHPLKFVIHEFFRKAMCVVSFSTVSILCFINLKYRVYFENKTKPLHENYSGEFCSICIRESENKWNQILQAYF